MGSLLFPTERQKPGGARDSGTPDSLSALLPDFRLFFEKLGHLGTLG